MQMVAAYNWKTFLNEVTEKYRGQLVRIELDRDAADDQPPAPQVPCSLDQRCGK